MKLYLAGGMTGIALHNFPAFDAARDRLVALGHEVVSPADIDRAHGIDGSLPLYDMDALVPVLREELLAIFDVDALYMLAGWERSRGAKVEHALAELLGKRIVYESDSF